MSAAVVVLVLFLSFLFIAACIIGAKPLPEEKIEPKGGCTWNPEDIEKHIAEELKSIEALEEQLAEIHFVHKVVEEANKAWEPIPPEHRRSAQMTVFASFEFIRRLRSAKWESEFSISRDLDYHRDMIRWLKGETHQYPHSFPSHGYLPWPHLNSEGLAIQTIGGIVHIVESKVIENYEIHVDKSKIYCGLTQNGPCA